MAHDEVNSPLEREKFLEEIRRRAEEAELARIEAEELKLSAQLADDGALRETAVPPSLEDELCTQVEQQLREALVKKDVQRASSSYDEILLLNPRHPSLEELRTKLARLRGDVHAEHIEEPQATVERAAPKFRRSAASFIQSAREHYYNERYDAALADLDDATTAEPDNEEIATLRSEVIKAKELADRIAEEERARTEVDTEASLVVLPPREAPNADEGERSANVEQQEEPKTAPASATPRRSVLATLRVVGMAFLVLLGIAAGYVGYKFVREKYFPGSVRILVLSAQTSNADLSITDGLTEELITHLAHVPSLEVFAPRTAMNLRSADRVRSIHALDPDYVLQLKVERHGDRFVLHASLTEGAEGDVEFEQEFTATAAELGGFCATMVPPLVAALDAKTKPLAHTATNGEAFDAYLRGRFALQRADILTLDSAASALEQSCAADPRFESAEVALGWVRLLQYEATLDTSKEKLVVATYRLRRAINLGAQNAEAFRLWGALDFHNGDISQAIEHFATAVRLAPSDAEGYRRLALASVLTANLDGALSAARRAAQLDPHNPLARETYGLLLMVKGENETALKEFEADQRNRAAAAGTATDEHLAALVATNNHETALDILRERAKYQPNDYVVLYDLGRMYQLAGKPKTLWEESLARAQQIIERLVRTDSADARAYAYLGLVQTRLGDFAEGVAAGRRAHAKAPHDVDILYHVARIYALQRDKHNEGFEQLAAAVRQRLLLRRLLDLDLQNLRNDPGFLAKIARRSDR